MSDDAHSVVKNLDALTPFDLTLPPTNAPEGHEYSSQPPASFATDVPMTVWQNASMVSTVDRSMTGFHETLPTPAPDFATSILQAATNTQAQAYSHMSDVVPPTDSYSLGVAATKIPEVYTELNGLTNAPTMVVEHPSTEQHHTEQPREEHTFLNFQARSPAPANNSEVGVIALVPSEVIHSPPQAIKQPVSLPIGEQPKYEVEATDSTLIEVVTRAEEDRIAHTSLPVGLERGEADAQCTTERDQDENNTTQAAQSTDDLIAREETDQQAEEKPALLPTTSVPPLTCPLASPASISKHEVTNAPGPTLTIGERPTEILESPNAQDVQKPRTTSDIFSHPTAGEASNAPPRQAAAQLAPVSTGVDDITLALSQTSLRRKRSAPDDDEGYGGVSLRESQQPGGVKRRILALPHSLLSALSEKNEQVWMSAAEDGVPGPSSATGKDDAQVFGAPKPQIIEPAMQTSQAVISHGATDRPPTPDTANEAASRIGFMSITGATNEPVKLPKYSGTENALALGATEEDKPMTDVKGKGRATEGDEGSDWETDEDENALAVAKKALAKARGGKGSLHSKTGADKSKASQKSGVRKQSTNKTPHVGSKGTRCSGKTAGKPGRMCTSSAARLLNICEEDREGQSSGLNVHAPGRKKQTMDRYLETLSASGLDQPFFDE